MLAQEHEKAGKVVGRYLYQLLKQNYPTQFKSRNAVVWNEERFVEYHHQRKPARRQTGM